MGNICAKSTLNKCNKVFIEKLILSSSTNSPLVWTPKVHHFIHKQKRHEILSSDNLISPCPHTLFH